MKNTQQKSYEQKKSLMSWITSFLFKNLNFRLNNQYQRDNFVIQNLAALEAGNIILDAGCGSQRYRKYCSHLNYKAQDFGQYSIDCKKIIGSNDVDNDNGYKYGTLDFVGNIWAIQAADDTFDAILCTEVFEHIPYPNETLREFVRLLKPNGKLILTAPSNCLRHMDPYFFYSGFSDRWYEKFLTESGFHINSIESVGDYYSWLAVEMARTASTHSLFVKIILFPAFIYYLNKKKSIQSIDTLCMGYHVIATKKTLCK